MDDHDPLEGHPNVLTIRLRAPEDLTEQEKAEVQRESMKAISRVMADFKSRRG